MSKKNIKIIGLYLLSILCLMAFLGIHNSDQINSIIVKGDNFRPENGFFLFLIVNLSKYGLLLLGLSIFLVLSFRLIKK